MIDLFELLDCDKYPNFDDFNEVLEVLKPDISDMIIDKYQQYIMEKTNLKLDRATLRDSLCYFFEHYTLSDVL
jgi:hypothetical protein